MNWDYVHTLELNGQLLHCSAGNTNTLQVIMMLSLQEDGITNNYLY